MSSAISRDITFSPLEESASAATGPVGLFCASSFSASLASLVQAAAPPLTHVVLGGFQVETPSLASRALCFGAVRMLAAVAPWLKVLAAHRFMKAGC